MRRRRVSLSYYISTYFLISFANKIHLLLRLIRNVSEDKCTASVSSNESDKGNDEKKTIIYIQYSHKVCGGVAV